MPVTVTEILDVGVHVSVEVPEPVTLLGPSEQEIPALWPRLTTPAKPFKAATVIVELPDGEATTEVGSADMVKSGWGLMVTVVA